MTMKTIDHTARLEKAIQRADFGYTNDRIYHYEYRHWGEGPPPFDTIEALVAPYLKSAQDFQVSGRWSEAWRIYSALLGVLLTTEEASPEWDEDLYFRFQNAAEDVLRVWSSALALAEDTPRLQGLLMLTECFCAEHEAEGVDYEESALDPRIWAKAFATFRTARQARKILEELGEQRLTQMKDSPFLEVVLGLLLCAGDLEQYFALGRDAVYWVPSSVPLMCEAFLKNGRRAQAIELAEETLETHARGRTETRLALLRFLVREYDPQQDRASLIAAATNAALEGGLMDDYVVARDLLQTHQEREALLKRVQEECEDESVIAILSLEARWRTLLELARSKTRSRAFPQMIERLGVHFPEACFELCRERLWSVMDSGVTGGHMYEEATRWALLIRSIPGQEDALGELLDAILRKYPRRTLLKNHLRQAGLMALVERVEETRRLEREAQLPSGFKDPSRIEAAIERCPLNKEDRRKAKAQGISWQPKQSTLVWAILEVAGGSLQATELLERIQVHRKLSRSSALSVRSAGLKPLEALGYVKVERIEGRLREVCLSPVKNSQRG